VWLFYWEADEGFRKNKIADVGEGTAAKKIKEDKDCFLV
jgi:hypothetical protein